MKIQYVDVEIAFEFVSFAQPFEHEAYINLQTGEIYYYSRFGDNEKELPTDIDDVTKYISLPHKNDLGLGRDLALDFAYKYLPEEAQKIENIFRRKGAYFMFKCILEENGILQDWYNFERKAQEDALREWCKINGLQIIG